MKDRLPDLPADADVATLLERRVTLERWLAKLDDLGGDVSARVADRVRSDYEGRLREVREQLSARQDAVRAEMDGRLQDLARVEDEHASAREALEEALLRQRIGELSDQEWSERRPELEDAVATALERLESLRAETARLETVLADIAVPPPPPPPRKALPPLQLPGTRTVVARSPEADDTRPPAPAPVDEPLPLLAEPTPRPTPRPSAERPAPRAEVRVAPHPREEDADDRDFLEQLDRAIAHTAGAGAASDLPDGAPRRGAKCPECGYTNDVGAWYCGVCGVDFTRGVTT